MKRKPELIVPIRDRRRRRRIFTLKNFAKAALVAVIVFVLLSFDWHRPMSSDYGRLLAHPVTPVETAKPHTPVVVEGKVEDRTGVDPLLIEPAAREQALGVNLSLPPRETATIAPASIAVAPIVSTIEPQAPRATGTRGVVIVGDANGVAIVKSSAAPRPVLSGGIFKQ
ncbi:MAG: hypothetical protein QOI24_4503 [Acidobacteriota bacterium]|jgi:hypothetical protein|nr:hypothetical protein [Acidobacteriota bacterium]